MSNRMIKDPSERANVLIDYIRRSREVSYLVTTAAHVVAATLEDISEDTDRERILREISAVPASRRARITALARKTDSAKMARLVVKYWK
jgi:hypothetical protein